MTDNQTSAIISFGTDFEYCLCFPFTSEFYCLSIGAKRSGAVLGEVVMEGNVVVFDRANQRIGFAPSNMSHPDVGPCGKKSPNRTGKGSFKAYELEFVKCYPVMCYDTKKL